MHQTPTGHVVLKNQAAKSMARRHPWIFSGALQKLEGKLQDGDLVRVLLPDKSPVGIGYWNSQSEIVIRMLVWENLDGLNENFWRERLEQAIARRNPLPSAGRLVNAENDFLPGLVVDKYGDWLVIQCLSLGIDCRKQTLVELLVDILKPTGIYERSDVDIRAKEGLQDAVGTLWGDPPPETILIEEHGQQFHVDVRTGHKTGFYLDQRDNRLHLHQWLSSLPQVGQMTLLNAFCFSGSFSVVALSAGVGQVISVDSSESALDLAKRNFAVNGFSVANEDFVQANVFDLFRTYRENNTQFDMILLDPPKFARHAGQITRASRGYKDINWLAFRLLKPGGYLWTFSCSNAISEDLFQKIVFGALQDTGRNAQIIGKLGAASDHPIALNFPEGAYLKGLICRVV
jgi:23S rRNA (cytosine1962-C5)-methyltransferase